ncbi:MAG TPA: uroporphyrinogen-III synthase [Methanomassiliicoccales archaeon]|nr:uroporphyrinogen-III synthase [Methanomassiliicoccales archaeon]
MTVLAIMRPKDRLQESIALARDMGFEVVAASPVDVEVHDSEEFSAFLKGLANREVEMVVFTSATGVDAAFDLADHRRERDALLLGLSHVPLISIGPVTKRRLDRIGLRDSLVPKCFTSEGAVEAITDLSPRPRTVWVLRSDQGSKVMSEGLESSGVSVREVVVYRLHRSVASDELMAVIKSAREGRVDAFAFTSSMSAHSFVAEWALKYSEADARLSLNLKLVGAIGPPTKKALEALGVKVDVMPEEATFVALLRAIRARSS